MSSVVTYHLDGPVATITMDDGKVNAFSPGAFRELNEALDQAEADRAVVVLTGRPGIFSAGFDLGVLRGGGAASTELVSAGFELAARVLEFPAPVVAACTGHAVAMGLFLVLAADYRIGTEGSFKFTANEVAIGLTVPASAIALCRLRLAPGHLSRFIALAQPLRPGEAAAAGLLDEVVAAEDLPGAAARTAAALAQLDQAAHAATKRRLAGPTVAAIQADLAASRAEERLTSAAS
jgi:enoyl-CoA hydratase